MGTYTSGAYLYSSGCIYLKQRFKRVLVRPCTHGVKFYCCTIFMHMALCASPDKPGHARLGLSCTAGVDPEG